MDRMMITFIILGSSILFLSFIVFIIVYAIKKKKEREKVLSKLGDKKDGSGEYEGISYDYRYYQGTKNSPSYFKVEINCPSNGSFKIGKESGFDRFSKMFGIAAEIDTGDSAFDENFYITTDDTLFTQQVLSSSKKRQAIKEIIESGFNKVEHTGEKMIALCQPFKMEQEINDEFLHQTVNRLSIISQDMPEMMTSESAGSLSWKMNRITAFAIPIVLGICGIIALLIGISRYSPLDKFSLFLDSLKYSIPLFIIYIWLAIQLLKGRSSSHRELLIVFFISITAFILGGWGIAMFLNGYLDNSPATSHTAKVLWKSTTTSDNSKSYHAHVKSWRLPDEIEEIDVTSNEYNRIKEGNTYLSVTTKPGKYGYEWIVDYNISP